MKERPEFERIVQVRGRTFRLQVETSDRAADYAKYDALRQEIWGFAEDHLPSERNLMCENFLHEGGSLLIAVTDLGSPGDPPGRGESLAGFSYGFVGIRDKSLGFRAPDNLWFYSQYTGVKEEFQSFGLGVRIKEFQAHVLRGAFGIHTVTCTYDPLTAVNARRNVHHFGMEVREYRVATYGEYGGFLNRQDVPSDRFFMLWDLKAPLSRPLLDSEAGAAPQPCVLEVGIETVRGRGGPVELEVVRGVLPGVEDETVYVPIPGDFYRLLRETDVGDEEVRCIPLKWRLGTRRVFQDLLSRGYAVRDFLGGGRRGPGYYVLRK
ncbi:MAG: hypothetical protein A2Y56_10365 [Candidatus Aminicenantes bacterium RBG_13_63_10]|nr:MAG: hypothetical protein A2Y56_10365 [Candidatus Aminicenantes bacterium RBG_13_63_10]